LRIDREYTNVADFAAFARGKQLDVAPAAVIAVSERDAVIVGDD
jgi:hypothetical protein